MKETLKLDFSRNPNNKLGCDAFSTVRLDHQRYQPGQQFAVWLKDDLLGTAECVAVYRLKLAEVSDRIALLDVGKPGAYLRAVLTKMYQGAGVSWDVQLLAHVILTWQTKEARWHELLAATIPKPAKQPDALPPIAVQASLDLPGTFKPAERSRGFYS